MASSDNAAAGSDERISFQYVFIPADTAEDIQQRCFECSKADDVMAFLNTMKQHFRKSGSSPAQRQAMEQAMRAKMGAAADSVNPGAFNALMDSQLVEPIPLLSNTPATGFVCVNMYCDDQASFKQLPLNARATAIAAAAGQHLQVHGDVFIGRLMDNEEDFKRLDFTLPELSSSAPWFAEAQAQALRRNERSGSTQQLLQQLQGKQQQQQQKPAGSTSPADAEKVKGNQALAKGDLQAALEHYSAALKLQPSNVAARNNRAMVYLRLHKHAEAAADCDGVLQADGSNVKALLRRAAARQGLGGPQQLAGAVSDLERVLQLEPHNADAHARLPVLQQQLEQAGDGGGAAAGSSGADQPSDVANGS